MLEITMANDEMITIERRTVVLCYYRPYSLVNISFLCECKRV